MIVPDNLLFAKTPLFNALQAQIAKARLEVDAVSKDQLLANADDQVVDYVYAKMEISPLVLYRDQATLSEACEIKITRRNRFDDGDVQFPAVEHILIVPYSGETDLWKMKPSMFSTNLPHGSPEPLRGNDQAGILKIKLQYPQGEYKPDAVNNEISREFTSIEQYIVWINKDVEQHNQQLRGEISRLVKERRERLGAIQAASSLLNIPIQKRAGAPDLTMLLLQKKVVQPLSNQPQRKPEYAISTEDYENILQVIRHEGRSFERTPATFAKHDEEELRDILLAHLNGHYHGQAASEAFRKKGKTDICIEFENRSAFVAECKVWKGEKLLMESLDQLLGYLTWRDVKTSLILLNKEVAGFQHVQSKIEEFLSRSPSFLQFAPCQEQGEWRAIFRSREDPDRKVTVHVFLFNLYVLKS